MSNMAEKSRILTMTLAMCTTHAALADVAKPSAADVQRRVQTINNAMAAAVPVRQRVADYRQHHDGFPDSNEQVALPAASSFRNSDVKSIAVGRAGVVTLTLTASSGIDGGTIVLTPDLPRTSDDNQVRWTCASASYSTISDDTLGVCEYTKLP